MPPQLILEVYRFRISKDFFNTSKSRKIVAFAEFSMKNKTFRSAECHVNSGSQYCLPWSDAIDEVHIHFYYIDDLLAVEVGSSVYELAKDKQFLSDGSNVQVILPVKVKGSLDRVGKVMLNISVQAMFEDDAPYNKKPVTRPDASEYNLSIPGFRFRRLTRTVNWERIRAFHMDRVIQNNDTHSLLACLDDLATGDVTQEDVDPKLHKLLQMEQYGMQYLLACHDLLKGKEKIVTKAIKTFEEEEALLDLKIAKMRGRHKALERESRDCDGVCADLTSLLRDLNPRLIDNLYRSYKNKQYRDSQPDPTSSLESFDASEDLKYSAHNRILTVPRGADSRGDRRRDERDYERYERPRGGGGEGSSSGRRRDQRSEDHTEDYYRRREEAEEEDRRSEVSGVSSHHSDHRYGRSGRRGGGDRETERDRERRDQDRSRDHRGNRGRGDSEEVYYRRQQQDSRRREEEEGKEFDRKGRSDSADYQKGASAAAATTVTRTTKTIEVGGGGGGRDKAPSQDYNWVQKPVVDVWGEASVADPVVRASSPPAPGAKRMTKSKSTSSELSNNSGSKGSLSGPKKVPSMVGDPSADSSPVPPGAGNNNNNANLLTVEVESFDESRLDESLMSSDKQVTGEGFKTVPRITAVNRVITVGSTVPATAPPPVARHISGSPLSLSDEEGEDDEQMDLVSRLAAQKGQQTTSSSVNMRQSVTSNTAMSVDSLNPSGSAADLRGGALSRASSTNLAATAPISARRVSSADDEDIISPSEGPKLSMTYPQPQTQSSRQSLSREGSSSAVGGGAKSVRQSEEEEEEHYSADEYENEEFDTSVSQQDIMPVVAAPKAIATVGVSVQQQAKRADSKGDSKAVLERGGSKKIEHDDDEEGDIESDEDVKQQAQSKVPLTISTSLRGAKSVDSSFPSFEAGSALRESTDAPLTHHSDAEDEDDDDDDDPFGFGPTPKHGAASATRDAFGRSKQHNLSVNEPDSDVDTSRSVLIDFNLPSGGSSRNVLASQPNRDSYQRKNNNLSVNEPDEVDTSNSVLIDFTLPSSDKPIRGVQKSVSASQIPSASSTGSSSSTAGGGGGAGGAEPKELTMGNRTGVINYLQSKSNKGGGMNSSLNDTQDTSALSDDAAGGGSDFDMGESRDNNEEGELSLADSGTNQFAFSSLAARSTDEDNVLLGTSKFPTRGGAMSTGTLKSQMSVDMFDKLPGGGSSGGAGGGGGGVGVKKQKSDDPDDVDVDFEDSFNDFMKRPSIESPWNKGSSTPVTPGRFSQEESFVDSSPEREPPTRMGSLKKQTAITSIAMPPQEDKPCKWTSGRASLELIELAKAFDVYVSAIRLDDLLIYLNPDVMIKLVFLGVTSPPSKSISMASSEPQPISFYSHMLFNEDNISLLRTEIGEFQESLAFQINVYSSEALDDHVKIAHANVNLWVMIEDSINLSRQEIDLYSADDSELVGSIIVDVRGYLLLQKAR